jgi:hypothetical protein
MFELYSNHIDPDNGDFQAFIKNYLSTKDTRQPEHMPYPQLYRNIRDGIREYIEKTKETKGAPKK